MTFFEGNPATTIGLVALIALWLLILTIRFISLKRSLKRVNKAAKKGDVAALIGQLADEVISFSGRLNDLEGAQARTATQLKGAIQRVGLVRFDAFGDIGGGLSFALAILNENGDGLVISTINGRTDSRSYAKVVKGGEQTAHSLSSEEQGAIAKAMGSRGAHRGEVADREWQNEEI
ncbi:MAG: DUF4446 family protein [Actinomycetota bacterium]|nr:DUF4446 family protein [Actinomycetota bacterium]